MNQAKHLYQLRDEPHERRWVPWGSGPAPLWLDEAVLVKSISEAGFIRDDPEGAVTDPTFETRRWVLICRCVDCLYLERRVRR